MRRRSDSGMAAVEFVILLPVLLTAVLLIMEVGLWAHARSQAIAAAEDSALAAAVSERITDASPDVVSTYQLSNVKDLKWTTTMITVGGASAVEVVVSGSAKSVIPGIHLGIRAKATALIEQFQP